MDELDQLVIEVGKLVDAALGDLLPAETVEPERLHAAMRWSTFAGGKRFRPLLVMACGRVFGAPDSTLIGTAAAVEMMHTFSLIHDDLPSMDDDDLRRGQPTCHKKYGEATAILAGDALQTLAFRAIAGDESLTVEMRLRLVADLALATGTPSGMVAGQQLDLEAEGTAIDGATLENIHSLKTGALIRFSAFAGALIGDAGTAELEALERYSDRLGLLFQITDDLLDVTQTTSVLGKTAGKDAAVEKATYPKIYGFENAAAIAKATHDEAIAALENLGERASILKLIASRTLERGS